MHSTRVDMNTWVAEQRKQGKWFSYQENHWNRKGDLQCSYTLSDTPEPLTVGDGLELLSLDSLEHLEWELDRDGDLRAEAEDSETPGFRIVYSVASVNPFADRFGNPLYFDQDYKPAGTDRWVSYLFGDDGVGLDLVKNPAYGLEISPESVSELSEEIQKHLDVVTLACAGQTYQVITTDLSTERLRKLLSERKS